MYLDTAKKILKASNPKLEEQFRGVSAAQITLLEQKLQKKLPLAFIELLEWFGKSGGNLMCGSNFYYTCWIGEAYQNIERYGENANMKNFAIELLNENGLNGEGILKDAIIIMMHQGYIIDYIKDNEGENPPVYSFSEGTITDVNVKIASSLSQYIEDLLTNEGKPSDSLFIYHLEDLSNKYSYDDKIKDISFNGSIKSKNGKIPQRIFDFINLESLDLRYFELTEIDDKIKNLKSLKYINLNFNGLKKVSSCIFQLPVLEEILLCNNELITLPKEIYNCMNLKKIDLTDNYLSDIEIQKIKEKRTDIEIGNRGQRKAP